MKGFDKKFQQLFIDALGSAENNNLKNKRAKLYKVIIDSINAIVKENIINDSLVLVKHDFTNLKLKVGKRRIFVFCGCYVYKGDSVILLELKDTIGTFMYKDSRLYRQIKDLKIGTIISLEKTETEVNLVLPYESVKIGLFDNDYE
jgi:hypothetical protein